MNRNKAIYTFAVPLVTIGLVLSSLLAAYFVGYLLGWLTGASRSPVISSIAPLVFGLLAVLGVSGGLRQKTRFRMRQLLCSIAIAWMVIVFCYGCYVGVAWGNMSRLDPYKPMDLLLGEAWEQADDKTAAQLHAFRLRARRLQIPHQDFEAFVIDVIKPILDRGPGDQPQRINAAIETANSALTADNKTNEH